jgi:hypothetical protein
MVTKLELINFGTLDITDDIPIALNFNLNDVRDISNRGGVWSKTIKIPGTQNNNDKLGNIYNVNLQTQTFNPVIKENCRIIVDGITIFEGVFQLRKVNKKFKNSQDFQIEYICYIKSDVSSFYESISGKYLDFLDLSQFNHDWELNTIETSMNSGVWSDGYQYFLPFKQEYTYTPIDFTPAVYAKIYWDEIFSDVGYTYEWDELGDLNFDRMIIPYNGEQYKPETDAFFKFAAGMSNSQTSTIGSGAAAYYSGNLDVPINYTSFEEPIIFNNDNNFNEGWVDTNDLYNTVNGRFDISTFDGIMEFELKLYNNVILNLSGGVPSSDILPSNTIISLQPADLNYLAKFIISVHHKVYVKDSNGVIITTLIDDLVYTMDSFNSNPVFASLFSTGDNSLGSFQLDTNFIIDTGLYPNADYIESIFYTQLTQSPSEPLLAFIDLGFAPPRPYIGKIKIESPTQNNEFGNYTNNADNYVVEGSPMKINKLIPKKILQSDFILSIIKMFNLYIREDEHNPKNLIVKTRDKFYEDGVDINWTDKLDIKSVDVELISNKQKKRKLFSYKEDTKDTLSALYKDEIKEIYGQLEYIFENEFIKSVDKIEPIFSPTFIVAGGSKGMVNSVPFIDSAVPKNNIRILYCGDVLNGKWEYNKNNIDLSGFYFNKTEYRYAGHLYPNPSFPMDDLFFGECDYYSHTGGQTTDNNLYNRFYKTQMNIFETGHIMTARFNLTYKDILNINLNERIYVYDSWWNINEIKDFDMNKEGLTKVELITSDPQAELFTPNNNKYVGNNRPNTVTGTINWESITNVNKNKYGSGVTGVIVGGSGNVLQPGNTGGLVIGNRNKVAGDRNIVQGNNNKILGENNMVQGDNFDIKGNYITLLNKTTLISDFIDAGRNTILNHFPENKVINVISGGRDEVRPLGSFSIENIVLGGRDRIR